MDEAPQQLSAVFTSLIGGIRDEVNALKDTNTSLLARIATLEEAHTQSQSQLDEQKAVTAELTASLAHAHKEDTAIRQGLDEMWKVQNDLIANFPTPEPILVKARPKKVSPQATDEETEPTEYVSCATSNREASMSPSSLTFCNSEQSRARREKTQNLKRALEEPSSNSPSKQLPTEMPLESTSASSVNANKRKRMAAPTTEVARDGAESANESSTAQLPLRTSDEDVGHSKPFFSTTTPSAADVESARAGSNSVDDTEDNIAVASRMTGGAQSATDDLLDDFTGDAVTEATRFSQQSGGIAENAQAKPINTLEPPTRSTADLLAQFQARTSDMQTSGTMDIDGREEKVFARVENGRLRNQLKKSKKGEEMANTLQAMKKL